MRTGAFDRLSRSIAREFLSSVVVVDDQALLAVSAVPGIPHALKSPGRQGGASISGRPEAEVIKADVAHRLDAKRLTDGFARIGVVCSILRPEQEDLTTLVRAVSPVAASSDVIILDWVLHEFKQGEKTVDIIKNLLKSSGLNKGRARLIVIYTGESDLEMIGASVRTALKLPEQTESDDRLTIEKGAARICIYAKEQSRLVPTIQGRKVSIERLPELIVDEFAKMTRGLVSNVALSSLAALRANTYQLLRRFHKEVDPPYVTHSTLLGSEEASEHLIPLIVSEIQAVLEDSGVSDNASPRRIVQWLQGQVDRGLEFDLPQKTSGKEFLQGMAYLLEYGVSERSLDALFKEHGKFSSGFLKSQSKNKASAVVREKLTETITLRQDQGRVHDHELALLMSVRSRYSTPPPRLSLGSIVLEKYGKTNEYLLCVQPRCDSVRLERERPFPFLPLQLVKDGDRCDFIVQEGDRAPRLLLNDKPFDVRMITFIPGVDKRVLARRGKGGYFFRASSARRTYRWIADLKPDHAQRVANEYAHKIARVGLTESEWLRSLR